MSFVIRPARPEDLPALYEMAKLTGGGFTNLPPDREALSAKLARTGQALARGDDGKADELIVLVLENAATGQVRGTSQIFSEVGQQWPFYSYRLSVMTQHSRELARTFRAETLTLTTDLEGSSEVGGLFLHPRERAEGLGQLLARSRYLYIRQHRPRFGDRVIAELRGVIDEAGGSPFWDGLAGRFFGLGFQAADEFNAIHGNQFIADLMPKTPIYTAMLTDSARSVIGLPHPGGRAAMRMLEAEGLAHTGYVDIFDGGPTMVGETDRLRTIAQARDVTIAGTLEEGTPGERVLAAFGRLAGYRCVCATIATPIPGEAWIDPQSLDRLGAGIGDTLAVVAR